MLPGLEDFLKQIGLGSALVYAGAAYGVFFWLDKKASDEAKGALARLLKRKDYDAKHVSSALVELFDLVYTRPLFRSKAFIRSAMITSVFLVISVYEVQFLREVLQVNIFEPIFRPNTAIVPMDDAIFAIKQFAVFLIMTIFLDYVSLFAVRRWLMFSGWSPVFSLIGGLFIGTLIVLAGLWVRGIFWDALWVRRIIWDATDVTRSGDLFLRSELIIASIAVFIWMPLFGISVLILRTVTPISWVVWKMQCLLKDGKDHPLDAIGYVAATIVFSIALVWRLTV